MKSPSPPPTPPAIVRTIRPMPSTIKRTERIRASTGLLRGLLARDHGHAGRRVPEHVVDGPPEDRLAALDLRARRSEDHDLGFAARSLVHDRRPRAARPFQPARDLDPCVRLEERLRLVEDLV